VNVTPEQARRWVLVSMVGLLGMAAYKEAKGSTAGDVGMAKRLWGVGVLGLMLSAAADFVPQLAGPFAVLVLLGYATSGGDAAIENVLGKVSGSGSSQTPAEIVQAAGQAAQGTSPGVEVPQPLKPGTNF
jgi:hypothetical protein